MKRILWLVSWYPNRNDPLTGDFIERHAKAASLNNSITVIYVRKDHKNLITGRLLREERIYNSRCRAIIIYYKVPCYKLGFISRTISAFLFFKYFIKEANTYILANGKPDLVHVHIWQKAGLIALLLKWMYNLSFVISEQWSGFCLGARPSFEQESLLHRMCWKMIMKNALACSTVSDYLGRALKERFKKLRYVVIPNVVDLEIFRQVNLERQGCFRFIHISSLNYQKNPVELLEAIKQLSHHASSQFKISIYGPEKPELVRLVKELHIQHLVDFKNESSQQVLCEDLQQSDALILYSLYETFGCVIIEANACGLPVIVSDIPVFRENVVENVTGVFVPLHHPDRLAEKMLWLMENRHVFKSSEIVEITKRKYDFNVISKQFDSFYNQALDVPDSVSKNVLL